MLISVSILYLRQLSLIFFTKSHCWGEKEQFKTDVKTYTYSTHVNFGQIFPIQNVFCLINGLPPQRQVLSVLSGPVGRQTEELNRWTQLEGDKALGYFLRPGTAPDNNTIICVHYINNEWFVMTTHILLGKPPKTVNATKFRMVILKCDITWEVMIFHFMGKYR